jgi:hypothetical protein
MELDRPGERNKHYPQETPNTSIALEPENMRALRPLLRRTLDFTQSASAKMGEDFISLYTYIRAQKGVENSSMSLDFLVHHNFHLPKFHIFDYQNAPGFLEGIGFEDVEIDEKNILLVFQFPDLISRWLKHKYVKDEFNRIKPKPDWEVMVKPLKKDVRKTLALYSKTKELLDFRHLNEKGEHNQDYYHYMWEVGLREEQPEDESYFNY